MRFWSPGCQALSKKRFGPPAPSVDVLTNDLGVRTPSGVRYPDVVADRGGSLQDLAATAPLLIAEVLSPSSLVIDLVEKAEEYTAIPLLHAYVVLAQDEPRLWAWRREAEGWTRPVMVAGRDATLDLPELGLRLPLARLHAHLGPG